MPEEQSKTARQTVFTVVLELLSKGKLGNLNKGSKDLETFVNKHEGLKAVITDTSSAVASLGQGIADWWNASVKLMDENLEALKQAQDGAVSYSRAMARVFSKSVGFRVETMGIQLKTVAEILSHTIPKAIAATYLGFKLFTTVLSITGEAMSIATDAAFEYNRQLIEMSKASIIAGKSQKELTANLTAAGTRKVYADIGEDIKPFIKGLYQISNLATSAASGVLALIGKTLKLTGISGVLGNAIGTLGNIAKQVSVIIDKSVLGKDYKFNLQAFKDASTATDALTARIRKISVISGASFDKLAEQHHALANQTRNTTASIRTLETAYAISAKAGFENMNELIGIMSKLNSGVDVSAEVMRKYGFEWDTTGGKIATVVDKLNFFIEKLQAIGGVSDAEIEKLKKLIVTNEAVIAAKEVELATRKSLNKATALDEFKTARDIVNIGAASDAKRLHNLATYVASREALLRRTKQLELGYIQEIVAARSNIFGVNYDEYAKAEDAAIAFYKKEADLLSTNADRKRELAIEGIRIAQTSYAKQLNMIRQLFTEATSLQKASADAAKGAFLDTGAGNAGAADLLATENKRLKIIEEEVGAIKEFYAIAGHGDQVQLQKANELLAKEMERFKLVDQRRRELESLIVNTQTGLAQLAKFEGQTTMEALDMQKQVFHTRLAQIKEELKLFEGSARARINLRLKEAEEVKNLATVEIEARKRAGQAGISILNRTSVELRKSQIQQRRFLDELAKNRVNVLKPTQFAKELSRQTTGTLAGTVAEIKASKQVTELFNKNADMLNTFRASLEQNPSNVASIVKSTFDQLTADTSIGAEGQTLVAQELDKILRQSAVASGVSKSTNELLKSNSKQLNELLTDLQESRQQAAEDSAAFRENVSDILTEIRRLPQLKKPLDDVSSRMSDLVAKQEAFNNYLTSKFGPEIGSILDKMPVNAHIEEMQTSIDSIYRAITVAQQVDIAALQAKKGELPEQTVVEKEVKKAVRVDTILAGEDNLGLGDNAEGDVTSLYSEIFNSVSDKLVKVFKEHKIPENPERAIKLAEHIVGLNISKYNDALAEEYKKLEEYKEKLEALKSSTTRRVGDPGSDAREQEIAELQQKVSRLEHVREQVARYKLYTETGSGLLVDEMQKIAAAKEKLRKTVVDFSKEIEPIFRQVKTEQLLLKADMQTERQKLETLKQQNNDSIKAIGNAFTHGVRGAETAIHEAYKQVDKELKNTLSDIPRLPKFNAEVENPVTATTTTQALPQKPSESSSATPIKVSIPEDILKQLQKPIEVKVPPPSEYFATQKASTVIDSNGQAQQPELKYAERKADETIDVLKDIKNVLESKLSADNTTPMVSKDTSITQEALSAFTSVKESFVSLITKLEEQTRIGAAKQDQYAAALSEALKGVAAAITDAVPSLATAGGPQSALGDNLSDSLDRLLSEGLNSARRRDPNK